MKKVRVGWVVLDPEGEVARTHNGAQWARSNVYQCLQGAKHRCKMRNTNQSGRIYTVHEAFVELPDEG